MELYHASNMEVSRPKIMNLKATLDFGAGFYMILNKKQLKKFAEGKMNNGDISLLLGISLIPGILEELNVPNGGVVGFLDKFYRSRLFDLLKEKNTDVWHLSARTLADIYREELETGKLNIPEYQ